MIRRIINIIFLFCYFRTAIAQNIDSISSKASDYYYKKDYANALILYQEILNKKAISDKDLFNLGKIYYQTNKLQEAIDIFQKLIIKEMNIDVSLYLARSYFKIDTVHPYETAKPYFQKVLNQVENDSSDNSKVSYESYRFMAYYYLQSKENYDSAIYYYSKIITLTPTNKEYLNIGYNGLYICYLILKDNARATFYYNKFSNFESEDGTDLFFNDSIYKAKQLEYTRLFTKDYSSAKGLPAWVIAISNYSLTSSDTTEIRYSDPSNVLKYAREILDNKYGKNEMDFEEPFHLSLIDDKFWYVYGSLPPNSLGGVATLLFSKYDGDVLLIMHYK